MPRKFVSGTVRTGKYAEQAIRAGFRLGAKDRKAALEMGIVELAAKGFVRASEKKGADSKD